MRALGVLCAVAVVGAGPARAQERSGLRDGFALPRSATIVLMRPTISVGAQTTGGLTEPNADWTDRARDNLGRALADKEQGLGTMVIPFDEPVGNAAREVAEYRSLFSSLAGSVMTYQFFPGNRLPTKKRRGSFSWSIGGEVARLQGLRHADYALFVTTEDQFGSTGRKMLQMVAAMGGVSVRSGVHKGYAGLIDLRTGDLVWLNADLQMGGDVRTPDGARKRVDELLAGFPARPAEATGPHAGAATP